MRKMMTAGLVLFGLIGIPALQGCTERREREVEVETDDHEYEVHVEAEVD